MWTNGGFLNTAILQTFDRNDASVFDTYPALHEPEQGKCRERTAYGYNHLGSNCHRHPPCDKHNFSTVDRGNMPFAWMNENAFEPK